MIEQQLNHEDHEEPEERICSKPLTRFLDFVPFVVIFYFLRFFQGGIQGAALKAVQIQRHI